MKRTWKGKSLSTLNTLDDSDMGQLCCYMLGHYVKFISDNACDKASLPMLGIYFEGSKVNLMRAKIAL